MAAANAHFYLAPVNNEVFKIARTDDVIIRSTTSNQNIIISPFPDSSSSNASMVISGKSIGTSVSIIPLSNNLPINIGQSNSRFGSAFVSNVDLSGYVISPGVNGGLTISDSSNNKLQNLTIQDLVLTNQHTTMSNYVVLQVNDLGQLEVVNRQYGSSWSNVSVISGSSTGIGGGQWTTGSTSNYIFLTRSNINIGGSNPVTELFNVTKGNAVFGSNAYVLNVLSVGTSNPTPGYSVDVRGDINFSGNLFKNGVLFQGSSGVVSSTSCNVWLSYSNDLSASNIYFYDSNCNGNVAIGWNDPRSKLHVFGDTRVEGDLLVRNQFQFGGLKIMASGQTNSNLYNATVFLPVEGLSNIPTEGMKLYTPYDKIEFVVNYTDQVGYMTACNVVLDPPVTVCNVVSAQGYKITAGSGAYNNINNNNFYAITNETNGINISTYGNATSNYIKFTGGPSQLMLLDGAGDLHVARNLYLSGVKAFDIPHPDPSKRSINMRLRHTCIESASRGDTIFTAKFETFEYMEKVIVMLPSYWKFLNENPRAFISCESDIVLSRCSAKVDNLGEAVTCICEEPAVYNIMVMGTRKDDMAVESFDEIGGVEYIDNK